VALHAVAVELDVGRPVVLVLLAVLLLALVLRLGAHLVEEALVLARDQRVFVVQQVQVVRGAVRPPAAQLFLLLCHLMRYQRVVGELFGKFVGLVARDAALPMPVHALLRRVVPLAHRVCKQLAAVAALHAHRLAVLLQLGRQGEVCRADACPAFDTLQLF